MYQFNKSRCKWNVTTEYLTRTTFEKQLTALHWRRYALYQQIVVKRGNFRLLIVNPQDNTGLCHYVISVRKTSVIGSTKRELKVMKSFKYKNFLLRSATVSTRILFSAQILSGFPKDRRNFWHTFKMQMQTVPSENWNLVRLFLTHPTISCI